MPPKNETMADIPEFASLDDFGAADTAEMNVVINGKPTGWFWTFAGPGHAKTIDQGNRLARERMHREKRQEQAQVNGKKYTAMDETVEDVRERNISFVVERLVGWSQIRISGDIFAFSVENARKILSDASRIALLGQAFEFLGDDQSFTRRSAGS